MTTEDKLIERLIEEARKSTLLKSDLDLARAQAIRETACAAEWKNRIDDLDAKMLEVVAAGPRLFELHEAATALLAMASSSKPRRGDAYKQAQDRLRAALQRAYGDCGLIPF